MNSYDEIKIGRDMLYSQGTDLVEAFRFDESVVKVFEDMIRRSVPGYAMVLSLLGVIAKRFLQRESHAYDLGCSLGASTLAMVDAASQQQCSIIAVDNSKAMIERCRGNILQACSVVPIELRFQDIADTTITNASLVTLNFTLQFLSVIEREPLLQEIANGLLPGGALLLSEKVIHEDLVIETLLQDLHHRFKADNGYTHLEISQKRSALEGILIPQSVTEHTASLLKVGFSQVVVVLQALNFVSILAIR